MEIRTLLLVDEPIEQQRLRRLLAAEGDFAVVSDGAKTNDARQAIEEHAPDVLFFELDRSGSDGLAMLADLPAETRPLVILVTSHREHAFAAFEVGALDYLLKPIRPARFRQTLTRVRMRLRGRTKGVKTSAPLKRVLIRGHERLVVIDIGQIDWMESANNYIVLHVGSNTHVLRETLNRLEQRLPPTFLRASRFAIVNLDRIREVKTAADGNHTLVMSGGGEVPLTRGIREVQERLESA